MNQPHDEKHHPDSMEAPRAQAIAGPFTLRDAVVGGSVLVMLIASLIPYFADSVRYGNLWTTFPLFFQGLGILLPLVVAGLFAGRRLSPSFQVRIGSLSVDQFASVVAVLAVAFFFLETVTRFNVASLIALIGALGLLAATTLAPHIPPFAADFAGRAEVPAHVVAREAVAPKPASAKPVREKDSDAGGLDHRWGNSDAGTARPHNSDVGVSRPDAARGSGSSALRPSRSAAVATGAAIAGAGLASGAGVAAASGSLRTSGEGTRSSGDPGSHGPRDVEGSTDSDAGTVADGGTAAEPGTAADGGTGAEPGTAADGGTAAEPGTAADAGTERATDGTADTAGTEYTVASDVNAEAEHGGPSAATSTDGTGDAEIPEDDSISATAVHEDDPSIQAFWFAVGSTRPVVDERTGKEIFTFEPGDWELCLQDRGDEFLVQNKHTGQVGIMKDLSDIQIPPSEEEDSTDQG